MMDEGNVFAVTRVQGQVAILDLEKGAPMSRSEATNLAAYLYVMAEADPVGWAWLVKSIKDGLGSCPDGARNTTKT